MIYLKKPDLRTCPVGEKVTTENGFVWELLSREGTAERWLDEATQLVWGTPIADQLNHYDCMAKYGDKIPSKEQFEMFEKHEGRSILGIDSGWFWSSSPRGADYAFVFFGGYGSIFNISRSVVKYEAVVCVASR